MRRLTAIDSQFLDTEELAPAARHHRLKVSVFAPGSQPYSVTDTKDLQKAAASNNA